MASVSVYNKEGKEVEKIDLNDSVFHSGQAAALCSHRFREIILSK